MRKSLVWIIFGIMVLVNFVGIICINNTVLAQGSDHKRSNMYMYGDVNGGNDGNLTTEVPISDTSTTASTTVLFTSAIGTVNANIGTWVHEQFVSDVDINGNATFSVWASGDVDDASFEIQVYKGNLPANQRNPDVITTDSKALGGEPTLFTGYGNITKNMKEGEWLEMDLDVMASDNDFSVGHNVDVHYASRKHDSNLSILCDSVKITPSWDKVKYSEGKITFIGEISDAFGMYDIVNESWSIKILNEGGEQQDSIIEIDSMNDYNENTVNVYWEWEYGGDKAVPGDYSIQVFTRDNSNNLWSGEFIFPLTQLSPPAVDVQIENLFLSNDEPEIGEKVYINATIVAFSDSSDVKATYVEIRFFINEIPIENSTISIETGASKIVTGIWTPTKEESVTIKVVVDPEEYVNDDKRENNILDKIIGVGVPPEIPDNDKEWYEEMWDEVEEQDYLPLIIPVVVIIVIIIAVVVVKKKKGSKIEIEEEEEGYELNK